MRGKASYPVGRVTFPVTFGRPQNYCIEFLTFEVADFQSGYHAILGRPMLVKFMAIPHHTYLLLKMSVPQGVLSGDVQVAFACDNDVVRLTTCSEQEADRVLLLKDSKKLAPQDNSVPEQVPSSTALAPTAKTKEICLSLDDPTKTAVISAELDDK